MSIAPDWKNPNREPVTTLMDLARLDEAEQMEGWQDGHDGMPCGDNRSRSYWHGWRQATGGKDRGLDLYDRELARNVGRLMPRLPELLEECRGILRKTGEIA